MLFYNVPVMPKPNVSNGSCRPHFISFSVKDLPSKIIQTTVFMFQHFFNVAEMPLTATTKKQECLHHSQQTFKYLSFNKNA